ncbi:MAG: hypothetical protein M1389_03755 [Chloroflexi bacterium]|nr:hypothetical protein [Chloroflexota bacterium]MCL5025336.1 hypothetical protein [Chloroflexota bacterium]
MIGIQGLVWRSIAGAVAVMMVGFIADRLVHTQGYWFVGLMAGLIGGAMSVYFWNDADEGTAPASSEEK